MVGSRSFVLSAFLICVLLVLSCGCISLAIGDVSYRNDRLSVHVTNDGDTLENAGIQVRIFEIKDLNQHELTNIVIPVSVVKGENDFTVPVNLQPGAYKLYVYLSVNGDRRAASIKDLVI
ncbi:MAG: hypothetical protein ABR887_01745 [Methanoregulaceae archaeon]